MTTLTHDEWLRARQTGIGGSEAPALFGEHPWLSQYELCMRKRGLAPEQPDNDVLWWGRALEPATRARFELEQQRYVWAPVNDPWLDRAMDEPWLIASVDGLAEPRDGSDDPYREVYEGKTAAFAGERWAEGEPPPLYTQIQVQQYLHVLGLSSAWIAVLILGRRECQFYRLERHAPFIERLRNVAGEWWQRHIVRGEDPPVDGSDSCRKALRARWPRPEPGRVVHLGADWIERAQRLAAAKAAAKAAEAEAAAIEAELRAEAQDAERIVLPDGSSYRVSHVRETQIPAHTRAAYTTLRRI